MSTTIETDNRYQLLEEVVDRLDENFVVNNHGFNVEKKTFNTYAWDELTVYVNIYEREQKDERGFVIQAWNEYDVSKDAELWDHQNEKEYAVSLTQSHINTIIDVISKS